jgi:hypothetical protein
VRADDTLLARRRHDPAPAHTTGSWDRDGFDVEEDEERSSGLRTLLERNVDHEAIAIEYANDKAVNEWQYDSRNDEPPTAPARATRRTVRVRRRRTEPT